MFLLLLTTGLYAPTSLPLLLPKHVWRSGRASAYGAKGRRFESGLVRDIFKEASWSDGKLEKIFI